MVGKNGKNINQMRTMAGVRKVFLATNRSPATLCFEVSEDGANDVMCFVQEKLDAAQLAERDK